MLISIVSMLLIAVAVYLFAGLVFTVFFLAKGLSKIDEGVHGSSWGFKIIIIPGCIVFLGSVVEEVDEGKATLRTLQQSMNEASVASQLSEAFSLRQIKQQ